MILKSVLQTIYICFADAKKKKTTKKMSCTVIYLLNLTCVIGQKRKTSDYYKGSDLCIAVGHKYKAQLFPSSVVNWNIY